MPTWDSKEADEIWTEACGKERWLGMTENMADDIRLVSDEKLWEMRTHASTSLIEFADKQCTKQLLGCGYSPMVIEQEKHHFDPSILTLGFARRFATYKRPNLLLHDPERLLRLLTNPKWPVQLILAGKAHPADQEGQVLIRDWMRFIRQDFAHPPVIFLADYDMHISENLVQGVDVWINTPRRPWEASGTSGMKVLVNGGLNLSELDGWWAEAYSPELGWALGDGKEHDDHTGQDAIEADQLYTLLEQEVVPEFYNRNEKGIPTAWIARMRESMAQLTPRFSADRTVREYTEQHYLPAAAEYSVRSAHNSEKGQRILNWLNTLQKNWSSMQFGPLKVTTTNKQLRFEVKVLFNGIDPNDVHVELFANGIDGKAPDIKKMKRSKKIAGTAGAFLFVSSVPSKRPATDYTPRIIPHFAGASIPLETNLILWQR